MRIRTKWNKSWTVLEIDYFTDSKGNRLDDLGQCDPNARQITIRKDDINKTSTLIHEVIHAIDFDLDIGLTENQVLLLEEGIMRVFKLNPVLVKKLGTVK